MEQKLIIDLCDMWCQLAKVNLCAVRLQFRHAPTFSYDRSHVQFICHSIGQLLLLNPIQTTNKLVAGHNWCWHFIILWPRLLTFWDLSAPNVVTLTYDVLLS